MTKPDGALAALGSLRTELHACGGERRDALFELTDALSTGGAVSSLAHLSTESVHRRGWGSAYAAPRRRRLDEGALGSHRDGVRLFRRWPSAARVGSDVPLEELATV